MPQKNAYAPYSKFHVGAALIMADDPKQTIFTGANIENSSYGVSNCGERTALFTAAAQGFRRLKYLAVSTADSLDGPLRERSPCGICRQAFREFVPLASDAANALFFVDTARRERWPKSSTSSVCFPMVSTSPVPTPLLSNADPERDGRAQR